MCLLLNQYIIKFQARNNRGRVPYHMHKLLQRNWHGHISPSVYLKDPKQSHMCFSKLLCCAEICLDNPSLSEDAHTQSFPLSLCPIYSYTHPWLGLINKNVNYMLYFIILQAILCFTSYFIYVHLHLDFLFTYFRGHVISVHKGIYHFWVWLLWMPLHWLS